MKKALQSRARYDWQTHTETRGRNARQIDELASPELPATGTARISALLEQARTTRLRPGATRPPGGAA